MPFSPKDLTTATHAPFFHSDLSEEWFPILSHACPFSKDQFDSVLLNLVKRPNINSGHLFRADILYDSEGDGTRPDRAESHEIHHEDGHGSPSGIEIRNIQVQGFVKDRTIVRKLIPRNPNTDDPLLQSCHFFSSTTDVESPSLDSTDSDVRALVVYIPHASDPSEIPFYHPTVRAVGFLYASSTISIHYALFPSITLSTRLSSTAKHLLATIHKHGVGIMKGYVKRGLHDRIVPQATYQDTYTRLKLTHARRLVEGWREVTDPGKHVFEDLGIAAYLIEIWTLMYGQDSNVNGMAASTEMAKECFPGFVDIGCGNGVLVDVLREEGWKGWGFDARRRKSWEGFPKHVQMESLKEALLVPEPFLSSSHSSMQVQEEIDRLRDLSLLGQGAHAEDNESQTNEASSIEKGPTIHNGIFPSGTFIISNHADELTAWTPLLASLSGNCPFLIIPCCSHDLSGARFRAPNPPKTSTTNQRITETASGHTGSLGSIIPSSTQSSSAYAALVEWVARIALDLGFDVEYDMLRIPSTRNAALLSRRMRPSLDHAQQNNDGTGNETSFKESAIYNKVGENQTTGVALNFSDIIERETNAKGRAAGGSGEAWIQRTLKLMQKQGKGKEKGHGSVKRKELAHSKLEGP